ncbi:MAG: hypothetical protein LBG44_10390 [Gemmatimonadota bacterium]|nr:hypothetical protein [Gemmatimonadota bacterium]
MMRISGIFTLPCLIGVLAAGCEPAEDVAVLPLPSLDRPTPEARYGIPEVKGDWRFAGWEVEPGDSSLLNRSYPVLGPLAIHAQRLDSIAGAVSLHGGATPVVGEIRRDGWFSVATLSGPEATAFITGRYLRDTLWLEMTSVIASEDWPSGARGVFVREDGSAAGPIAWFQGTNPMAPVLLPDSLLAEGQAVRDSLVVAPVAVPVAAPVTGGGAPPAERPRPSAGSPPVVGTPVSSSPAPAASPAPAPRPTPPPPAPPPAAPPARPRESGPTLLGEPVSP